MSTTSQQASGTAPPSGPRRGGHHGRRGGRYGGGGQTKAASPQADDTEEVRKLRTKYSGKLVLMRELFPEWTDEDLLFALHEAGGEMEVAVGRISEGHAEQFSSVKPKKQSKKEQVSSATPSTFQGVSGQAAQPSSQGLRGGRASAVGRGRGAAISRGVRGGTRGGIRGNVGRGGGIAPQANGHVASTSNAPASGPAGSSTGQSWADAVAASAKSNGAVSAVGGGNDWGDDTEGLNLGTSASSETPVTKRWDDEEEQATTKEAAPQPSAGATADTPEVKVPIGAPKTIPKGSKMSWAQIARPSEQPKPQVVQQVATAPVSSVPSHSAGEVPATVTTVVEEVLESQPRLNIVPSSDDACEITHPAAVHTTGEASQVSSESERAATVRDESTVASEALTNAANSKAPALPRSNYSQRSLQRSRQEAAVVMPGGGSQLDNLGVKFGTLSFLGGDDEEGQPEQAGASSATEAGFAVQPTMADAGTQVIAPEQPKSVQAVGADLGQQSPAGVSQRSGEGPGIHYQSHQSNAPVTTHGHNMATSKQQDAFTQTTPGPVSGQYGSAFKDDGFGNQPYGSFQQQQPAPQQGQAQAPQQQLQQQQQQLPGYAQGQPQQAEQSPYGAYNSAGQQSSQYGDYPSSMYGEIDSQRLSNIYGAYDQQATDSGFGSRGTSDERSVQNSSQQSAEPQAAQGQQHQGTGNATLQPHQQASQQQHGQQPSQQQQFPNLMPFYYPHYYPLNQFQHYAQPAAGYGQYAMYGNQPQHPSKPGTPANVQSPYAQAGPHTDHPGYGGQGQYGHSPATTALGTNSYEGQGFGQRMQVLPNVGSDYSKLYGGANSGGNNGSGGGAGTLPGLGGFLGQSSAGGPPSGSTNGTGSSSQQQQQQQSQQQQQTQQSQQQQQPSQQGLSKTGGPQQSGQAAGGSNNVLESAYRQYDSSKAAVSGASQARPQQHAMTPQQQQYYQQYNAYAHQPNASGGSYGNYPYRQYWGH